MECLRALKKFNRIDEVGELNYWARRLCYQAATEDGLLLEV